MAPTMVVNDLGGWRNESGRIHISCPTDNEHGHTWDGCASGEWRAFQVCERSTPKGGGETTTKEEEGEGEGEGEEAMTAIVCVHKDVGRCIESASDVVRTWRKSDELGEKGSCAVWSDNDMMGVYDFAVFPHHSRQRRNGGDATFVWNDDDDDNVDDVAASAHQTFLDAVWSSQDSEQIVCNGRGVVVSPKSGVYETSCLCVDGRIVGVRVEFSELRADSDDSE